MKKYVIPLFVIVVISLMTQVIEAEPPQRVGVTVTATTENMNFEATCALDKDLRSIWHSQFSAPAMRTDSPFPISCWYDYACSIDHPKPIAPTAALTVNNPPLPHDLMVDLGRSYEIKGFIYTPRHDGPNANGNIADYEFYLTDCTDCIEEPVKSGTFNPGAQTVLFDSPKTGRYIRFRSLREVNGQLFTSVAELEILSDGYEFVAMESRGTGGLLPINPQEAISWLAEIKPEWNLNESAKNNQESPLLVYAKDLITQYNVICSDFGKPRYFDAITSQTANPQSLILPGDRDPLDVIARRVQYAIEELDHQEIKRLKNGETIETMREKLEPLAAQASQIDTINVKERFQLFALLAQMRRVLLFSSPTVDFDEILFVKKHRSDFNHMCDQFYGRTAVPGGGLFVLNNSFDLQYAPVDRDLLANRSVQNESRLKGKELLAGSFVSPDLSFDGERIAFAWVECLGSVDHIDHLDLSRGHTQEGRCYHIFTCKKDGSDLAMITDGTWNDFDPCYLPNGRMAFTSERRGGYLRCGRDCPNYTLFDMNEDGTKKRCLSYHETNEWNPSVTNDGKIVWTRWDYIDRFGCIAHHPWTTTLDGRDPRSVHGNFSRRHQRPDIEVDVRAIPNSSKFMATAGPHHGQSYGSIILIDPQVEDDDAMSPLKRLTPNVGFPESQGGCQVWGTPWPLTESLFLAVADYSMQDGVGFQGGANIRGDYGIYLVDSAGNTELIYRDPQIGAACPIPFVARTMPPAQTTLVSDEEIVDQPWVAPPADFNAPRPEATITISNVYDSLRPWPEGTKIKELRVVQVYCMSVPSGYHPHEIGFRETSSHDSVNLARGALGTVPVEDDGSVHFTIPAYCEVFFQALDENGAAVQSMRSGTSLKEGETLSCTGCHEPKHQAATAPATLPLAFSRPPSRLKPEPEGSNPMSYPELVQPILEKHCVGCHDDAQSVAKGAPNLHQDPIERKYYASYNNLMNRGFAFHGYGEALRTTPGQFGAIKSKLYNHLKSGHHDVALNEEEMRSIVVWLDLLSNFYGVYEKEGGERQLRAEKAYPTLE